MVRVRVKIRIRIRAAQSQAKRKRSERRKRRKALWQLQPVAPHLRLFVSLWIYTNKIYIPNRETKNTKINKNVPIANEIIFINFCIFIFPTYISKAVPIDPDYQKRMDRLEAWLAKGAHLTRKQAQETTLLFDAANVGHVEATRALLAKPGIRVLKEDNHHTDKCTALHFASYRGHVDVVRLLLAQPAIQVDRQMPVTRRTPLYVACVGNHVEVVEVRLAALNIH